jgi:mediator of RNA polymerase II transcription subunit 18
MYELFLTALIEEGDLQAALSILTGICGMQSWHSIQRVLYFQCASATGRPTGFQNYKSLDKPLRRDTEWFLKELNAALSRQSFIMQARYDVVKDRDMGPNAKEMDFDAMSGILRWTEFPSAPQGRPHITHRKKIELWEQKKIWSLMADNSCMFKTEVIDECYRFYRDDVEFCLTRQFFLRPIEDYTPVEQRQATTAPPVSQLPAFEELTPVDAQNRWVLQVKAHVMKDNDPEAPKKAQGQLEAIRVELEGVFDFKSIDRKVHDTRVAQPQQNIQVLPQRVTLGKV